MKPFLSFLLATLTAATAWGQLPPEVDTSEATRIGNRVAVVGEGPRNADDAAFIAAMATPEDDSGKWFVTVWGMKGCEPCKALVKAFEKDPNLTAFVAAPAGGMAWAHFNYYQIEDRTQAWRAKNYKVESGPFPIVIIQPPLNKSFGNPSTVVDRIEAKDSGDPAKLKERIIKSVKLYCSKLQAPPTPGPRARTLGPKILLPNEAEDEVETSGGIAQAPDVGQAPAPALPAGTNPPFSTPPPAFQINPTFPLYPPTPPALTLEQIKAASPDADAAFWLGQLELKPTSPEIVRQTWELAKLKKQTEEATKKAAEPSAPSAPPSNPPTPPTNTDNAPSLPMGPLGILGSMLAGGGLLGLIIGGLNLYRKFRLSTGQQPILNDQQFQAMQAALMAVGMILMPNGKIVPAAPPPQPSNNPAP